MGCWIGLKNGQPSAEPSHYEENSRATTDYEPEIFGCSSVWQARTLSSNTLDIGTNSMTKATIEIKGERFVLIPEAEYEAELAATLPPLPPVFPDGTREARACIRVSIARDIIQERRELGLTQTQLAKLAGIRQETLSRLESGKHRPNERTVERIEAAFKRARGKR